MAEMLDEENHIECYVFVDNSNLWIEGQKSQALKDAETDPRYQVDHGKFLNTVIKHRNLANAFLYGSRPTPNDSVWKKALEHNFKVQLFDRSVINGKEKAIESAMTGDICKSFYQHQMNSSEEAVFIVVSGKLDLKHTIDSLLQEGAQFELWSWEKAMAREYKQLANKESKFEANPLENIKDEFSFTAFNTREGRRIKPECSIVFRNIPEGKSYLYELARFMQRLMRLFYVTSIPCSNRKQDLVFEFRKTKPEVILNLLKKMDLEYAACDYPTYLSSKRSVDTFEIPLSNRFEIKTNEPERNEDFYQNLEPFMTQSTEDMESSESDSIDPEDCWLAVRHNDIDKMAHSNRKKRIPCKWQEHCTYGASCRNYHSEKEMDLFLRHPRINFRYWKTKLCSKSVSSHKTDTCMFGHGPGDSWCLACGAYGHLTSDCKVKRTSTSSIH